MPSSSFPQPLSSGTSSGRGDICRSSSAVGCFVSGTCGVDVGFEGGGGFVTVCQLIFTEPTEGMFVPFASAYDKQLSILVINRKCFVKSHLFSKIPRLEDGHH